MAMPMTNRTVCMNCDMLSPLHAAHRGTQMPAQAQGARQREYATPPPPRPAAAGSFTHSRRGIAVRAGTTGEVFLVGCFLIA
jgi:hypothetical protein